MVESVAIPASIKLFYFDLPGWAEATRLMFKLRGIPFEDVTFSHEEWPKFKPNMPFGQVPVLEVDGQQLAQTAAIERYVAKLAGMYPDDPWQAAKGEELRCYCVECFELFNSARAIKDPEQQAAARGAIVDGPLQAKLAKLNEVLGALGPDTFVAGSKDVTVFDLPIFVILSFLCSGFLPGIPKDLLHPFPGLVAYHDRIARLPGIQAVYEGVTEGPRLAFKTLLWTATGSQNPARREFRILTGHCKFSGQHATVLLRPSTHRDPSPSWVRDGYGGLLLNLLPGQ